MPDLAELLTTLHPLEAKVLRALAASPHPLGEAEIAAVAGIGEAQARMASEWLLAKSAVEVASEETKSFLALDDLGRQFARDEIPELAIRERLRRGPATMAELGDAKELSAAIGRLRKEALVNVAQGTFTLVEGGGWDQVEHDQAVLKVLAQTERVEIERISDAKVRFRAEALAKLPGRSSLGVKRVESALRTFQLTPLGKDLAAKAGDVADEVSQLTPEMLRDGSWRNVKFRAYNLQIPPPRSTGGRRHPYREFLDAVRRKLISFGFEEMRGPIVESEFWNNDALFMPQFHPARAIHDVYFVEGMPRAKDLPEPAASNVAAAHENGGETGSIGWRYNFDRDATKRLILRSQGTALSARQLGNLPKIPGKYFAIARCFRFDDVDATHAPDFFQIEGIVLGEEVHLRHLLGLMKLFGMEIARAEEMYFTPGYFPFTEPSVEAHMRHPKIGWMELGGGGIFRPEVTKPFGIDVPVIAWGLGLDRMAMVALGIDDIHDLFSPDLDFLRSRKSPILA